MIQLKRRFARFYGVLFLLLAVITGTVFLLFNIEVTNQSKFILKLFKLFFTTGYTRKSHNENKKSTLIYKTTWSLYILCVPVVTVRFIN